MKLSRLIPAIAAVGGAVALAVYKLQKDKKEIAGKLKFVLPKKVGEVMQTTDVSKDEIFAAFDYITK